MLSSGLLSGLVVLAIGLDPTLDEAAIAAERSVAFQFTYEFAIEQVPADAGTARVWIPLPRRDGLQEVELAELDSPGPLRFTRDREYGNPMAYCELALPARRQLRWRLVHRVTRRQWESPTAATEVAETDAPVDRYLNADRLVPTAGSIADLARGIGAADWTLAQRARDIYTYCIRELEYRKEGIGWGRGDVQWVCDSRYGNCSDYHSLFIALCRARNIPAKFEIGFPLPYQGDRGEIAGYHCWAKFLDPAAGWFAADVSEADKHPELADYFFGRLNARRVHFSTGRDITLQPPQAGPPVNFLIYPYVEIDGKEHEQVKKSFSFEIMKDPRK